MKYFILRITNTILYFICFFFILSSEFNIMSFFNLEQHVTRTVPSFVFFWIVSILISLYMSSILFRLFQKFQRHLQEE